MQIFHGSNVIVQQPQIIINGYYKDFGYGFYCSNLEKQAKRWALTKAKSHIVNCYEYCEPSYGVEKINICRFPRMTEAWLEFVVDCRRGKNHEYDIVEGPMADDTIWDYIEDYVSGFISKAAFWELVKFKYPTHQISFHTDNALKLLQFTGSYCV